MRCRSLVLLSALLMLLTGCAQEAPAEPIFAIVEGVEIPVSRVDHTLALDEAAYEFSLRWIEDADFLTEEEKQEQIALMEPPTREAAEQELIFLHADGDVLRNVHQGLGPAQSKMLAFRLTH